MDCIEPKTVMPSRNGEQAGQLSFDPAELERTATPAVPDPFDPASMRLSQDFAAQVGVKKACLTIPIKKPEKTWFCRVHSAENYRLVTAVLELKEDREIYYVSPALRDELATETTFGIRQLFTTINRQGVLFLWPVSLPGPDGKIIDWHRSMLEAAQLAATKWVRVQANMQLGAYDVFEALGELPEPDWPDLDFGEILRTAFKNRFIDSLEHPILRKLRGEV